LRVSGPVWCREGLGIHLNVLVSPNECMQAEQSPSVCLTDTSFQKRFCSSVFFDDEVVRTSRASFSSWACFLFLATLYSASEVAGVGVSGGGPGTTGCGTGVARRAMDVCRQRYSGRGPLYGAESRSVAKAGRIASIDANERVEAGVDYTRAAIVVQCLVIERGVELSRRSWRRVAHLWQDQTAGIAARSALSDGRSRPSLTEPCR
jgi:hypothetical protein